MKNRIALVALLSLFSVELAHASNFHQAPYQARTAPVTDNMFRDYMMQTNSATLSDVGRGKGSMDIWDRIRRGFRLGEVRSDLVRTWEERFSRNPEMFKEMTRRARYFLYYIVEQVEKRNMPMEVALLPFIESSFKPSARSRTGALGIWQFMPGTGDEYGLKRSRWFDSRQDILQSTNAALKYLQRAYNQFGDWALAFAAYNAGSGKISREVRAAETRGQAGIFDNLRLVDETANYVPKLIAARNIILNPDRYGIVLEDIRNLPYLKSIVLDEPVDMRAIARMADISEYDLKFLNAGNRVPVWIPQDGRHLVLPADRTGMFIENYQRANPANTLSWRICTPNVESSAASIAKRAGMNVNEFKSVNKIRSDTLPVGSSVLVSASADEPCAPVRFEEGARSSAMNAFDGPAMDSSRFGQNDRGRFARQGRRSMIVRKGDNLTTIARNNGLSVKELKEFNGMLSDRINVGQTIMVPVR